MKYICLNFQSNIGNGEDADDVDIDDVDEAS